MTSTIRTDEVHEFTYAVSGAEIEFMRKDRGHGPAVMTRADGGCIQLSAGSLGFSAVMGSQLPAGTLGMQLVTSDPGGTTMCGLEVDSARPSLFAPETPIFGRLPAGVRATTLVTSSESVEVVAADLGTGPLDLAHTRMRMRTTPEVRLLVQALRTLTDEPALLEGNRNGHRLLEHLVVAIAADDIGQRVLGRRRDASAIVALAIDFVEQTGTWLPTLSELCRAALASESSLRAAFVEVFGLPPTTYFHLRVLRELRRLLVDADPRVDTVTDLASSLGLTQFGRVAGRYRLLYGETPSHTLLRRP